MKKIINTIFVILMCLFSQPIQAELTDQLVAYYPFNDSADDASGNNYHGTLVGPVPTTDRYGNENSAYLFDGINDRIDITNFNLQYNELSVSAWVLLTSNDKSGSPEIFCSADASFQLEIGDAQNGINSIMWDCFTISNRLRTANNIFTLNSWHLVTSTWNGQTSKIYLDGNEIASKSVTGTVNLNNVMLRIGSEINGSNSFWTGKIDEVRLYSRGLSAEEVTELYTEQPSSISRDIKKDFKLTCFPNPFNPATTINFTLSNKSVVDMSVYNAKGDLVENLTKGTYKPGSHSVVFNAANVNSGVYFVQMKIDGKVATVTKAMLVK